MSPRHIALAVLIAAIWGFNFVIIKVGVDAVPPFMLLALRFFFAAVPAIFIIARPKVGFSYLAAYGLMLALGQFGFMFMAVKMGLPAGLTSLVLQLQAFFTMFFAWLVFADVPKWFQIIGAVIAFAGIALIAAVRWSGTEFLPLMLCVIAAAGWGASNIIAKAAKPQNALSFTVWSSLWSPLPLLALSWMFEDHAQTQAALAHPTLIAVVAVIYLAALSTIFGYGAWNFLLTKYSAGTVAPFSLLVPIFGILSGVLVLGESFDRFEIAGALLVIAGLIFSNFGGALLNMASAKKMAEP